MFNQSEFCSKSLYGDKILRNKVMTIAAISIAGGLVTGFLIFF